MSRPTRDLTVTAIVLLALAVGCAVSPPDEWPEGACFPYDSSSGEMIVCRLDPDGPGGEHLVAAADISSEALDDRLDETEVAIVDDAPIDRMCPVPRTARLDLLDPDSLPTDDRVAPRPPRRDVLCPPIWWSVPLGWQCLLDETPSGEAPAATDCTYVPCSDAE